MAAATRRGLIALAGAASLLPAMAVAQPADIGLLIRQRELCRAAAESSHDDAETDMWSDRTREVEGRIRAVPCTTKEAAIARIQIVEDWMREYWMDDEAANGMAEVIKFLRGLH